MEFSYNAIFYGLLGIVLVLIVVFIFLNMQRCRPVREKFTDIEDNDKPEDYQARLKVIDVFDSYLKRNPTPKEISKYSQYENEQDIISSVMKDFPQAAKSTASPKPSSSPQKEKRREKFRDKLEKKDEEDDEKEVDEEEDASDQDDADDDEDEEDEGTDKKHKPLVLHVSKESVQRLRSKIDQMKSDVRDVELTFLGFLPADKKLIM